MRKILSFIIIIFIYQQLKSQVDSCTYYYEQAQLLGDKKKFSEADKLLDKALQFDSLRKDVYVVKAIINYYYLYDKKTREREEAKGFKYINKVLQMDSTYEWALDIKTRMFCYKMKYDSALIYINKRIRLNPNKIKLYASRAKFYTSEYEDDENYLNLAEKDLDKVITFTLQNPENTEEYKKRLGEYYRNRGEVKRLKDNLKGACEDFKKAIEYGIEIQIEGFDKNCNCNQFDYK